MSRPGGEIRWTRLRAQVSDEIAGRRLAGVAIDITERMRVESALSATENRLKRAQELGGALAFEWDVAHRHRRRDPRLQGALRARARTSR